MLYFNSMGSSDNWLKWAQFLQQKRLLGFILAFLDGVGPLRMILAQTVLGASIFAEPNDRLSFQAFAETLEDPMASRSFAAYLRNGKFQ